MEITVEKYTDVEAMRRWCKTSTGKESKMTLAKGYALGHSFIRSQRFYITLKGIPQFVASHLVRHKVGVEWVMKSKRIDRGGDSLKEECDDLHWSLEDLQALHEDGTWDKTISREWGSLLDEIDYLPYRFDRLAPTNLFADIDAEAIINISRARLCTAASKETREVWQEVVNRLSEIDPDLACHCVPPCIATGVCRENKCRDFSSNIFQTQRENYKRLFTKTNQI